MGNKYFKSAGSLDEASMGIGSDSGYFRPAGDLDSRGKNVILPKGNTDYIEPFKNPEEMVDYFRSAGSLDEASMGIGSDSGYFRPAGDLDSRGKNVILPKGNTDYIEPFKKPEEIVDYFKPASDLNKEIIIKNISEENKLKMINNIDEINDYLLTVVSGKKHPYVCELGVLMDGGRTIVSLKELQQMVDEGYNIVSARVINAVSGMIEVEFQKYVYDEEKVERWRRF